MNKQFMDAQDVFLGKINQICNKFGLNNIMAQIYAMLYLSNDPMSLNDMVERLKISKASASVNIRTLERYGVVRRAWVKGSRRDYYEAETDITKVITERIKSMAESRLSELGDMVESSYSALNSVKPNNGQEKEEIRVFKERLEKVKKLYDKGKYLSDFLSSGVLNNLLDNKSFENKKEDKIEASLRQEIHAK